MLSSGDMIDFLTLLVLIKEKKPVTLYYNNYSLFNETPQPDLMRVLALAQLIEIQIIIQKSPAIQDDVVFWKTIDNLRGFLKAVSGTLELYFQTGDITPAIPEGPDSGSQKTIFIRLRPNGSLFQQD
jgi:hypothetical protein